ncbi:hypothetical protein EMIT0158MI4_10237 [Burkholderia ambifaria]
MDADDLLGISDFGAQEALHVAAALAREALAGSHRGTVPTGSITQINVSVFQATKVVWLSRKTIQSFTYKSGAKNRGRVVI